MKKGIIVAITVVICAVLAATYTFANPSKAAKTEPTTKEKEVKEVTTTEKEKTTTEATTESKKAAIEEETSEESATDQEEDDSEEITDQKKNEPESDSEDDEDDEEIDDEEIDRCNHEWTEPSYAIDPEKGYVITQYCKKCNLVKDTPISFEEYEEATKDQEPREEDCEYEDNDDAEVVE